MLYFSYGSNMSSKRLTDRVLSARFVAVATLTSHKLMFHKVSKKDGSAKCDALETENQNDVIIGVVFDISESEKPELDKKEGLHYGYEEKTVNVTTVGGKALKATTYYATNTDSSLKPYDWYKEHVIRGAKENGLPQDYIQTISNIQSVADPKPERHEQEMQIYR